MNGLHSISILPQLTDLQKSAIVYYLRQGMRVRLIRTPARRELRIQVHERHYGWNVTSSWVNMYTPYMNNRQRARLHEEFPLYESRIEKGPNL